MLRLASVAMVMVLSVGVMATVLVLAVLAHVVLVEAILPPLGGAAMVPKTSSPWSSPSGCQSHNGSNASVTMLPRPGKRLGLRASHGCLRKHPWSVRRGMDGDPG
jgi:hypothetical protein